MYIESLYAYRYSRLIGMKQSRKHTHTHAHAHFHILGNCVSIGFISLFAFWQLRCMCLCVFIIVYLWLYIYNTILHTIYVYIIIYNAILHAIYIYIHIHIHAAWVALEHQPGNTVPLQCRLLPFKEPLME